MKHNCHYNNNTLAPGSVTSPGTLGLCLLAVVLLNTLKQT